MKFHRYTEYHPPALNEPDDEVQTDRENRVWRQRGIGGDVVIWECDELPDDAYDWTIVVEKFGPMAPWRERDGGAPPGYVANTALVELIESLESSCSFWACQGPDASIVGMQTCRPCAAAIELRALVRAS